MEHIHKAFDGTNSCDLKPGEHQLYGISITHVMDTDDEYNLDSLIMSLPVSDWF